MGRILAGFGSIDEAILDGAARVWGAWTYPVSKWIARECGREEDVGLATQEASSHDSLIAKKLKCLLDNVACSVDMPEKLSLEQRSAVMRAVKSKGNKSTEVRLVNLMKKEKIHGWRRGIPLIGKPDFVFRAQRIAVFVDGDFWHGHPKNLRIPRTRREYWIRKIQRNQERDLSINASLRKRGWNVIRLWESDLKKNPAYCVALLKRALETTPCMM